MSKRQITFEQVVEWGKVAGTFEKQGKHDLAAQLTREINDVIGDHAQRPLMVKAFFEAAASVQEGEGT